MAQSDERMKCLSAVSCSSAQFDGGRGRHAGRPGESGADPDGEGSRLRDQSGSCKDVTADKYNPA